jgi:hypothetical protein
MNTQTQHTPGPWRVKFDEIGFVDIYRAHDDTAGSLNNYAVAESVQSDSDARLIAASPDLLAACESALALLTNPTAEPGDADAVTAMLLTAIAKAKGEA